MTELVQSTESQNEVLLRNSQAQDVGSPEGNRPRKLRPKEGRKEERKKERREKEEAETALLELRKGIFIQDGYF